MQDSDFIFVEEIGSGTFASVYRGKEIRTNKEVALKKIFWNSSPSRIANELRALIDLKNEPGIIHFIGGYRDADVVTIVTDFKEHQSLKDILWDMDMQHIKSYMKQLLIAARSVHSKNIIHRDIKPGNFLYSIESDQGVLCDFGLCERFDHTPHPTPFTKDQIVNPAKLMYELEFPEKVIDRPQMDAPRAGTRGFRAPEVLWKFQEQTTAIDIWSIGVIFLSLLTRRYPFFVSPDDLTALCEISCIVDEEKLKEAASLCGRYVKFPSHTPAPTFRELIQQLNPCYEDMAIGDDTIDLLGHMMDPNMFSRYTAEQCLKHSFFATKDG